MAENLIVYGARCVWWDDIDKVGFIESVGVGNISIGPRGKVNIDIQKLPCCPYCKGVLFQMDEEDWWRGVDNHENKGHLGYRDFITWLQGKCFPDQQVAEKVYQAERKQ